MTTPKHNLFVSFLVSVCLGGAHAACRGRACRGQEASAAAAGLLGDTACVPQQYPKQGALLPVTLPGRISDLVWAGGVAGGKPAKVVFGLVTNTDGFAGGPLWRSDYYGHADSWKDITGVLQAALPTTNSTTGSLGVVAIRAHKDKPDSIFLQGRDRFNWVSSDGGQTFTAVPSAGGTLGYSQEMKLHPRQSDWLLAKAQRNECLLNFRSPSCGNDLFVSKDFGATWKNLTEAAGGRIASFRDFEWGATLPVYANKATPDDAIFATVYPGASSRKGLYPGWDQDLHYVVTLDLFASAFAKIIPCGNLFEVVANKVFLAVPSTCPVGPDGSPRKAASGPQGSRTVTVYVSDNDGDEFVEACLPASVEDDGYNIIHTHDGYGAFILADHAEPGSWGPSADSPTSDAYAPAYNVSLHTLSLPDIYRRDFVTDFSRVEGMPGMYMANQVDPAGRQPGSRGKEASFLRTRLSLTGGSQWQALAPPASFRFGSCNSCSPDAAAEQCALHLHGATSWFAPEGPHPNFYSVASAPGLVMATGNVGPHLDFSPDADCTYLSRDGGITWQDIAPQTAIYEYGNYGGLIAMASHRSEGPTQHVQLSVDQGACWHKVQLPEALLVDNIRVDPSGGGHVFLVHGMACLKTDAHSECTFTGGSTPPGKMFAIDVQDLLAGDWKECNTADDSPDYEKWVMPAEGTCLLGAKRIMRRRKRDAFCFNPQTWSVEAQVQEPCQCSAADVECEFGFEKGAKNTCVAMADLDEACPRMSNSGYLTSTTHLRLVHADQCLGVNDVIPDTNGRGGAKGSQGGGGSGKHNGHSAIRGFFVFLLTAGALAVAGGLIWAHCLAPGQREELLDRAAPALGVLAVGFEAVLGVVIDAWDWLREKATDIPFLNRNRGGAGAFDGDAYEPLSESGGGLDLDPEDHRSPRLFGVREP